MIRKSLLFILSLFFISQVIAQNKTSYPQYRSPLGIPLILSGTFAELRGGHFHAGLDIKTKGKKGEKVYAVGNGYVSRIKIQRYGYGKAIYITHPEGYTSVYAHLEDYNKKINQYVEKIQYKKKSYEIDITVPKDQLKVKKGHVIAYSGNSGGSGGPHLHFEIRKSTGQFPMNPMEFGCNIKDNVYPFIRGFKIYDPVNGNKKFSLSSNNHTYTLKNKDTLMVSDEISFGIQVNDKLNGANNSNGVYSIRLFRDQKEVFSWEADMFSFSETRYINAFIDYEEYKKNKRRFVMTKKLPGNHLSTYKHKNQNGIYRSNVGDVHHWRYEISDYKKNKITLSFITKTINQQETLTKDTFCNGYQINYNKAQKITEGDLTLSFPKNALYEDFLMSIITDTVATPTKSYYIGDEYIPIHKPFKIATQQIPYSKTLYPKLVWALFNKKEDNYTAISTTLKDGILTGKSRQFGLYTILPDTVAPSIKVLHKAELKSGKTKTVKVKIKDELSGIKTYKLMVNDNWVLAEYDPKKDLLIYDIDRHSKKGKNKATCIVVDSVGNETREHFIFIKH